MSQLEIVGLKCSYGEHTVLDGINLTIKPGEIVSLIGGSGSGKSTLLRVIMGLTRPLAGAVRVENNELDYDSAQSVREFREKVAIVFQQYNLFQNMSVLENVMVTPVKVQKRHASQVKEEAMSLLAKVGMQHKADAYPANLSGGQQQRVAISRALALKPKILLLDEVTSALDPELVGEVLNTVRQLSREGMTMILVSHEMSFVREVSHKVAMMDQGKIIEFGPPEQIFGDPQVQRTRDFVKTVAWH
ncbi:amino acid ABC transporter ATP-binding protein [Tatumella citrea]|uniref:Peptide ABC transporter ATP-binding protein n=1 Tax=Tatumella citrea TaxID=53336 RepID=A0A1Y0LFH0_TATCI|nr:amino acid ABC transporter ATP-binding protein [Tatumella citrea]ARU92795.1 peptide ABC transporter ATP-binding protein [Tatumella citrea]ARU96833.1 peptide ABC transporter ATP-binding protein [Tatumella citrea]